MAIDGVSSAHVKELVTKSITDGIADCQLDRENKTKDSRVKVGSSLASRIRKITTQIKNSVDCNKLQQDCQSQIDSLEDTVDDVTKQIKSKLKEVLPIVKVPTNPLKIPKHVKKSTIGRVLPDLDATIDLIKRTVELTSALSELAEAVEYVLPRLEDCNTQVIDLIENAIKNPIEKEIAELKKDIKDAIADNICAGLSATKISQNDLKNVFDTIDNIKSVIDDVDRIKGVIDDTISFSSGKIAQHSADLQDLTGIVPPFNTANNNAFMESINSDAYTQYKDDVLAVYNTPDPVSQSLPIITGNTVVGQTLLCSNGTWTANGTNIDNTLDYNFQWYRQGLEIVGANTNSYVPILDDIDSSLFCVVTAETVVTLEQAQSLSTSPITLSFSPANKPSISGTFLTGQTLTCSTGTWPTDIFTYYYEWYRGVTIVKARSTANTYTVQVADIGNSITCKVYAQTAKNVLNTTTDPFS